MKNEQGMHQYVAMIRGLGDYPIIIDSSINRSHFVVSSTAEAEKLFWEMARLYGLQKIKESEDSPNEEAMENRNEKTTIISPVCNDSAS